MMKNETPTVLEFHSSEHVCRLECLRSVTEMEAIADDWRDLETKSQDPFVYFQSFDWCMEWARHYVDGNNGDAHHEIRIYCLYCDGKLSLIWPMMVQDIKFGVKALTFLTEPLGQYGNILIDDNIVNSEMVKRVWNALRETKEADALTVNHYPRHGVLSSVIGDRGYFNKTPIHAAIMDLSAMPDWDSYMASLRKSVRKRRNNRRNKFAKAGEVGFEVHFGGTRRFEELIDEALDMKMRWLEETGRISVGLSTPVAREFLKGLKGTERNENGRPQGAVVQVLTLDGKSVGIEIGICLNDHYCSYLGAFDLDYHSYTPGKIQMELTQKWAKEIGFHNIDFLGDPAEYKSNWTDKQVELACNSVPITARGFFYCVVWKLHLRPWLKDLHGATSADARRKFLNAIGFGKPTRQSEGEAAINKQSVGEVSTKGI